MIHGNKMVVDLLENAVLSRRIHHALLFHGPHGVGKFTTALNIVKQLNCDSESQRACDQCRSCRRLSLPFPFYPDLQIFREVMTPVFLNRDVLFQQFLGENRLNPETDLTKTIHEYDKTLSELHSKGVFSSHTVCNKANPVIDIIQFNRTVEFSQQIADTFNDSMLGGWLAKKLQLIRTSHSYSKSLTIDMIRNMQKSLSLHSFEGRYKAVIIDDADRMLPAAQNCLLKTLEEPPGNTVIILIAMNPSGLLSTIRSRCQPIPFKRLSEDDLTVTLTRNFGYTLDDAQEYAPMSNGSVSEALSTDWELTQHEWSVFDQLFSDQGKNETEWIMELAQIIVEMNDTGNDRGVHAFQQWLHKRICESADSDVLHGILPGNRVFTMDTAIFVTEGLMKIRNNAMYHIDLQLNLETLFSRIFQPLKQVN